EIAEVDAVAARVEAKFDAAVLEALAAKAFTDAEFVHELDGVIFEKAGPDAFFDVGAVVELNDDGLDAEALDQKRQEEAGGAGADKGEMGGPVGAQIGPLPENRTDASGNPKFVLLGKDSAPADWLLIPDARKASLPP